jgi:hypothetical protein
MTLLLKALTRMCHASAVLVVAVSGLAAAVQLLLVTLGIADSPVKPDELIHLLRSLPLP